MVPFGLGNGWTLGPLVMSRFCLGSAYDRKRRYQAWRLGNEGSNGSLECGGKASESGGHDPERLS